MLVVPALVVEVVARELMMSKELLEPAAQVVPAAQTLMVLVVQVLVVVEVVQQGQISCWISVLQALH